MIPTNRPPTPPGEILLEEFLKPQSMTRAEAARRMGIPPNWVNEVIRGKRGITADMALRLARLLGTSPEFWMNLQTAQDLYAATREDAESRTHREAEAKAPLARLDARRAENDRLGISQQDSTEILRELRG